ncbi:MAG: hypothetical protein WCE45_07990 [Sedimentisphaerales bacterium]
MKRTIFLVELIVISFLAANAIAIPAFPGAEGYGAVATGGRGGVVYEVTNLSDSGTGSLRAALNHNTTRTIVFRVSGTIHLTSNLSLYYGNVTIAGQTAPGDGICIANGSLYAGYTNVIIRYIRCRLGDQWPNGSDNDDTDATWGRYGDKIILDHVTASWSVDETFSYYLNQNFTAQWCMMTESLYNSHHEKGPHGFGGIWGNTNSSWHHNLLAHHSSRNPRIDGEVGTHNVDLRNNVIYNWGYNSCYGGDDANVNIVKCYYKYGPATGSGVKDRIVNPSLTKDANGNPIIPHRYGWWYVTGNYVDGYPAVTSNNWLGVDPEGGDIEKNLCYSATQFPVATTYPVTEQTAEEAYNYVLNNAGCCLVRDSIDTRIINEVATGTATYGGAYGAHTGIIDSQTTVGGWPTLNSLPAPTDTDHDGMPDAWETANGLSPTDAADRNYYTLSTDYTNLEVYLNSLCRYPYAPMPNPMTFSVAPYAVDGCSIAMTATTATCGADGVEYFFTCYTSGGHSSSWQTSPSYTDIGLIPATIYTYTVKARNQTQPIFTGAESNSVSVMTIAVNDFNAPLPNPMTWAVGPHGTDLYSISMTATTATDDTSGVEYYFANLTVPDHNSGWQDSATYTDTGLARDSEYTYTVKARDKSPNHNETAVSDPCTGMTLPDTTAPEPNPMTFAVAPYALDINSIAMVATTATDISGVEYFFANITDPNHNSGWQDNTDYTDTNLINDTTYSYSVIARDKSLGQNETAWSSEANATTVQYTCSGAIDSDLDNNCKVDFIDYALLASHWNKVLPINDIVVNGTFDTDIIPGWQIFDLPSAVGYYFTVIYGVYDGNPAGSALVSSDQADTGTSGHYFYQVMPVDACAQYKLSADWMGDISGAGYVESDPCNLSNWAQVLVAFETSADANAWTVWTDANAVMYGKTFGVANQNIDSSGTWFEWEPITASQINGPADGLFTASGDYMVVAFSVGGLPDSGPGYFYADNVKVEGTGCSPADLNGDCSFDWLDIEQFATDWLSCNRNPASECMLP